MAARYDLVTSRKDREGKTRYTKIGVMFPAREGDGFSMKLEALPLPNDAGEVWINAFVPKEKDDAPPARTASRGSAPSRPSADLDDSIPFAPETSI